MKKSELKEIIREEINEAKHMERKEDGRFEIGDTFYVILKTWQDIRPKFIKKKIKSLQTNINGETIVNNMDNIKECGRTKKEAKKLMLNIISGMNE